MKRTLGKKFDEATTSVFGRGGYDSAIKALGLIENRLISHADVPDNDFYPQFKRSKEEPRLPDWIPQGASVQMNRHEANRQHTSSPETIKQIQYISIQRNGVEHDFPIRLTQKAPSLLSRAFTGKPEPKTVVTITGFDGTERSFISQAHMSRSGTLWFGGFADKAAKFMVTQLQQKALHGNKPSAKNTRQI